VSTRILGVRHHGPGSARCTAAALAEWQPDVVLIEGPPEGEPLLPWLASASMVPPVALLVYVPDEPRRAVCYPFARFSPEWQALRYAAAKGIPARFIDLPHTHWLAFTEEEKQRTPIDAIGMLAEAAGSNDSERWWEHMVEHRRDSTDVFQAVMEAMTALRESSGAEVDPLEQKREAHMRQMIRAAEKDGFERIAVVCGAWHAPALAQLPAAKQDAAVLKGLPKVKVQAAWVPWTHGRLQWVSGYGAGIESPGWYDHLWQHRDQIATRWLASVAALLREQDMDASPAQLIDSVRLADALAAMRRLLLPGLEELMESVETVLLFGNRAPLQLIHDKLIVGETLGQVPDETPAVPLQQDLTALQKRLRMPAEAGQKVFGSRSPQADGSRPQPAAASSAAAGYPVGRAGARDGQSGNVPRSVAHRMAPGTPCGRHRGGNLGQHGRVGRERLRLRSGGKARHPARTYRPSRRRSQSRAWCRNPGFDPPASNRIGDRSRSRASHARVAGPRTRHPLCSASEYRKLQESAHDARTKSTEARVAVKRHTAEHGC
jgi:hypothetical protein